MHHIRELKAKKPIRYDMTLEEWQTLHRKAEMEDKIVFDVYVQLLNPFATSSQVKAAAGLKDLPAVFQVETCSYDPEESPRMISVCRIEYEAWEKVEERLDREGYEEC